MTSTDNTKMFEAAVCKFVKTVGRESLIAVPTLDEANRCRIFQVVVKKNRRWFWQSPQYEPSPFQLHELLIDTNAFTDVEVISRELATYNRKYRFDVNGKTGAKLVSLLDFKVDASDDLSVGVKFGEITKLEVDLPALQTKVDTRLLDLKHAFIEQVRADPRKSLCVVVGSADLKAAGSVHITTVRKVDADEEVSKSAVSEDLDLSFGDNTDVQLDIPAGTPVAYNVCELLVKEAGQLELMVERDSLGGFEDNQETVDGGGVDEVILEALPVEEQFGPLDNLDGDDRHKLRTAVLNLCATPVDVETILKLLKKAQRSTAESDNQGQLDVKGDIEDATVIMEMADCTVAESGLVVFPADKTEMLDAIRTLFEAIIELDDEQTIALNPLTLKYTYSLRYLLNKGIEDTKVEVSEPSISVIYEHRNVSTTFVNALGFVAAEDGYVEATYDNEAELEGAYRAVYGLWGETEPVVSRASGWGGFRCQIL